MTAQPDYPICLRLSGKPVLVVGGGTVAEGRVCGLLVAQARVRVVSPELTDGLRALVQRGEIEHVATAVTEEDVEGHVLVLACADDPEVNAAVVDWARARGIWVNAADDPPNCDFTLPSVLRRGDLVVAVSTGGNSPGYAADLRRRLEPLIDEAEAQALDLVREQRARLRAAITDRDRRFQAVNALVAADLASIIRREGLEAARARAMSVAAEWIAS